MQSSTSNVPLSTRIMWKTFSERPPRRLWRSDGNKGTIRGRGNVYFYDEDTGLRTSLPGLLRATEGSCTFFKGYILNSSWTVVEMAVCPCKLGPSEVSV